MKTFSTRTLEHLMSPEFVERFWRYVDKDDASRCWNWRKSCNNKGYGQINAGRIEGKLLISLAHRVAWIITHDGRDPGAFVLHSCDNPQCCNPAHLSLGDQIENMKQMDMRGRRNNSRHRKGELHGMSKLNDEKVRAMRQMNKAGVGVTAIARTFGVSWGTTSRVINGTGWSHVT